MDEVLAVVDLPVLAAGGVATPAGYGGRAHGRRGRCPGRPRLLLAEESSAHSDYRSAVIAAHGRDTVLTDAFNSYWPDAPHRVLRASLDPASRRSGDMSDASYPDGGASPRFAPTPPSAQIGGPIATLAQYAGKSVSAATEVLPAAQIVRQTADGAEAILKHRVHDLGIG